MAKAETATLTFSDDGTSVTIESTTVSAKVELDEAANAITVTVAGQDGLTAGRAQRVMSGTHEVSYSPAGTLLSELEQAFACQTIRVYI